MIDSKGVKGSVYIINTFFFINNYIIEPILFGRPEARSAEGLSKSNWFVVTSTGDARKEK